MKRIYAWVLYLFPRSYREEFGEELQTVFNLSLDDARSLGIMSVAHLVLRELLALPGAILHAYLRERRDAKMIEKFDSGLSFPAGTRSEFLAAIVPFFVFFILLSFIPLLVPYAPEEMPAWGKVILDVSRLGLLGFVIVLLVLGFGKGLPRWFLPYLGFIFSVVSILAFNFLLDPNWRGFSFPAGTPQLIRNFAFQGLLLIGILALVSLLVMSAMLIPKFRSFYSRVRNDWTLLAFIIYGAVPFAILLTFDSYEKSSQPYLFGSLCILAVGGWFYLRSDTPWKKFLLLYIGMALSMVVAALGRAILCKNGLFDEYVLYCTWQVEMMDTVTVWLWLAIFMLLTFAINLLPRSESHFYQAGPQHVQRN